MIFKHTFFFVSWIYEWHGVCIIRDRNYFPFASTLIHPRDFWGPVLLIFLVFCVVFCFCFICLRSVSCVPEYCQCLWFVHYWLPLWISLNITELSIEEHEPRKNRGWTQMLQRVSICIWENDKMWSVYRQIKKQTTTIHIALMADELNPTYVFSLPPQQESYQNPVMLAPQVSTQMLCILPTTF